MKNSCCRNGRIQRQRPDHRLHLLRQDGQHKPQHQRGHLRARSRAALPAGGPRRYHAVSVRRQPWPRRLWGRAGRCSGANYLVAAGGVIGMYVEKSHETVATATPQGSPGLGRHHHQRGGRGRRAIKLRRLGKRCFADGTDDPAGFIIQRPRARPSNLAEVSTLDKKQMLPPEGILYFFFQPVDLQDESV